jgi:hypothetical protein
MLTGLSMASVRALVDLAPPCRQQLSAPLRAWLDDPANAEPNIWPDREPAANMFTETRPVTVAVWDTGLDYTLFAAHLAADPAEPLDGRDNDGNGVVDDVHARLTPTQLIDGMMATATPNSQNLRLIHPAAAVDWARRQLP